MSPNESPLVIGLTGSIGSGCTRIAQRLEASHRLKVHSLSDILKEQGNERGRGPFESDTNSPEQRKILQDLGDELRSTNQGVLAEIAIDRIRRAVSQGEASSFVIDSIRNPGEVKALRSVFPRFFLVAVNAPWDVRWERVKRKFNHDQLQFELQDERDRGEGQPPHGQQVQECVDQADFFISNEKHCETPRDWERSLYQKLNEFVGLVLRPGSRTPKWDELYMGQAYAASLRSTCCKRKVGAVIARPVRLPDRPPTTEDRDHRKDPPDTYLISSGWNEVPSGVDSCQTLGGDGAGYCVKDQKMIEVMQKMVHCPGCGKPLEMPRDASTSHACMHCGKRVIKDFSPGRQLDLCPAVHAEEMAMLQASKLGGISLSDTVLYTTTFPCLLCARKIIHVGIETVVYAEPYPDKNSVKLLEKARVTLKMFEGVTARAYFRLFQN